MVDFENKPSYDVADLKNIIELLRSPKGCPWDSEQTHESIRRNLLEEAYEAAEAIDERNTEHLCEELGDVLMQVVFHADIEEKAGRFSLDSVADAACKKLIRRHPHVFGQARVKDSVEVLSNWDAIKRDEKNQEMTADAMRSVARSLPALWRAEKLQKKASKVGFDWPDHSGAMESLCAELRELEDAVATGLGVAEELGDLIFSAVNVARFFNVDPEQALGSACDKFISRFGRLESAAADLGRRLDEMTLDEMDKLYRQVKLRE
ncbi:MAG: nucleoside triphosphate pyrophosphohydrolase [Oscillospiraceae bacterium]|nr:nucleoside triphosphate pyrophosphohydrolase [Oscillospiraceae bacterium]